MSENQPIPQIPKEEPNPDWQTYRTGGRDKAGRKIKEVYARDDDYVLYFNEDGDLFYEVTPELNAILGNADVALARINRLLPSTWRGVLSGEYRYVSSILELAADAYEMIFCGHVAEGLGILNDIRDKLVTIEEGKLRLFYQSGAVCATVVGWCVYLVMHNGNHMPEGWEPWVLATVLGMAGGAFSVCLNLGSLSVSINQKRGFLFIAGFTRSVIALLAGVAILLAMRGKMFAGLAYQDKEPSSLHSLIMAECFFCFLAGFSETFVPNILRDSEKNGGNGGKASEQARSAEQAKAADELATAKKTTLEGETKQGPRK